MPAEAAVRSRRKAQKATVGASAVKWSCVRIAVVRTVLVADRRCGFEAS